MRGPAISKMNNSVTLRYIFDNARNMENVNEKTKANDLLIKSSHSCMTAIEGVIRLRRL